MTPGFLGPSKPLRDKPCLVTSKNPVLTPYIFYIDTMAPLELHWQQPSHPDIQEVIKNEGDFVSKSISRIAVAPFGVYADLAVPPYTIEDRPTYATCQIGRDKHISLNSDLLYMNHSCEPSLVSCLCQDIPTRENHREEGNTF